MAKFKTVLSCVVFVFFGGCAAHPLTENYEGYSTVKIVEHIRCEARRSIQDNAIGFLRHEQNPRADQLADYLATHRSEFKKFDEARLSTKREKDFYKRYIKTGIALGFTLDITEDNAATAQIDFLKAITHGTFGLGAAAGNDRMREASRQFLITDTFQKLLDDDHVCPDNPDAIPLPPNLIYPVTGSIGLAELIGTFIQLNEEGITLTPAADKAPVFADTLNFTTTFTGSVTPRVTLMPAGPRLGLMDASLTDSVSRKDANKVIVGLSLEPPKAKKERAARGVVGASIVQNFGFAATVFAKRGLTETEFLAVQAISQTRIDTYFDRSAQVIVR